MKTGLFLAAMVQLASAQPHHNRHAHMHDKREVVTEVQTVTATAQDAVVFVNQQGQPISTSYVAAAGPQATPHSFTSVVAQAAPAPSPNNKAAAAAAAPAAPAPAHHAHHKGGNHEVSHGKGKTGLPHLQNSLGVVYSPYNADNSCKSAGQVQSDLARLGEYDYIRLYGVDCNQVANVAPVAKSNGKRLFLGLYDIGNVANDVGTMHAGLGGNWGIVDAVSVGNELVNSGQAAPSDVVAAIGTARGALQSKGYTGPVTTVDTFLALQDNPELCQASDFAAANAHAFFDSTISAPQAGSWTKQTQQDVAQACGKPCIITEAGWPHAGNANGAAVPGPSEQAAAVSSIKSAFSHGGAILFTAFDDLWKTSDPSTFNAEQYWGILSGQ